MDQLEFVKQCKPEIKPSHVFGISYQCGIHWAVSLSEALLPALFNTLFFFISIFMWC